MSRRVLVRLSSAPVALWSVIALLCAAGVWLVWDPAPLHHPDAATFDASARKLLDQGIIAEPDGTLRAWRAPGNTLFIAAVYGVSGRSPGNVVAVQLLLFA